MSEEPKIKLNLSQVSNPDLVDMLGRLRAKIAPFTEEEEAIKDELKLRVENKNDKTLDGKLFHVCVSTYDQDNIDKKAMIAKLGEYMKPFLLTRFLAKITKTKTVTKVIVTARIREG